MVFASLVMNITALTIKVLPIILLWSDRFKNIVPSSIIKVLMTVWYVLMPNIQEVHRNVTNAHWILALYAIMILCAAEAKKMVHEST